MPSFRGEYAPLHPEFPKGSAAACVRLDGPPPTDMEDIAHTTEDDAAVEEFVRNRSDTTWHPVSYLILCMRAQLNPFHLLAGNHPHETRKSRWMR